MATKQADITQKPPEDEKDFRDPDLPVEAQKDAPEKTVITGEDVIREMRARGVKI